MMMKIQLGLLLLCFSFAQPSYVPPGRQRGEQCFNNDQSPIEAICKLCYKGRTVMDDYVANLSPEIIPNVMVQHESAIYSIHDDRLSHKIRYLNISLDIEKAEATVYWTQKPVDTLRHHLPVRICRDANKVDKLLRTAKEDSVVIFTHRLYLSNNDIEALIGPKRLTIGTLVGHSLRRTDIKRITFAGGHVLSNLRLPRNFKDSLKLVGQLFVFSPLDDDTSDRYENNPTVNLANLMVIDDQADLCSKTKRIELFSDWTSETLTFSNVPRPEVCTKTNRFTFSDHYGTHLEFGTHFTPGGGMPAAEHPICQAIGRCVKVVAYGLPAHEPIPLSVFKDWEARHNQRLPEMVLVQTGCEDLTEKMQCPGISPEAVEFLLTERSVKVLGTDSPLFDPPMNRWRLLTHEALAKHDAVGIVELKSAGLEQLSDEKLSICLLNYLRIQHGTGSPVAITAYELDKQSLPEALKLKYMSEVPAKPTGQEESGGPGGEEQGKEEPNGQELSKPQSERPEEPSPQVSGAQQRD